MLKELSLKNRPLISERTEAKIAKVIYDHYKQTGDLIGVSVLALRSGAKIGTIQSHFGTVDIEKIGRNLGVFSQYSLKIRLVEKPEIFKRLDDGRTKLGELKRKPWEFGRSEVEYTRTKRQTPYYRGRL